MLRPFYIQQMLEIYLKYICMSKLFSVGVTKNVLLCEFYDKCFMPEYVSITEKTYFI